MHLCRLRPVLLVACLATLAPAHGADRPHILYITADDLGWKDVGYHGSTIQTPTLDRLAGEGARLEQFYAQSTSTQTRAAFLTGRYPMRYGLQTLQIQWFSQFGLPAAERTLANALKQAGYRTVLIGKWHLGHASKQQWPTQRGYDYFYGHLAGQIDYLKHVNPGGQLDWQRSEKPVREQGYATTLLAKDAARLIRQHDPATPLFLHLAFAAPQAPLQAPAELLARYRDSGSEAEQTYRAMITGVDTAIGEVLRALETRAMRANTLVIFHAGTGGALPTKYPTGDGDTRASVANNGPYRDGRGSLREGGLRVAALAHWPGHVAPGAVSELIHVTDLYPTLLKLAGGSLEQSKPLDGMDVWPTIAEGTASPRKEVLLNVEDFRGALRIGDWKLIVFATLPARTELYNLKGDPSEEDNQADKDPDRVQSMLQRLTEYAWEMAPAQYLEELAKPRRVEAPMYWGDNPVRP